ncbi:MAG TPA: MFS transporter [Iamia sp.]|nr:MFS transporter [Iamia sp.]
MPDLAQAVVVDDATAASLLAPRSDIVAERAWTAEDEAAWREREPDDDLAGDGWTTYAVARGPMRAYRRDVRARPAGAGGTEVEERIRYQLALGVWSGFVIWPANRALRQVDGRQSGRSPVWAPPENLDARSGTILGLLLTLSLLAGYMGTVLTQTITYAADEFDRSVGVQGNVLAAVRVGVLGSLAIVALSDRKGRRRLLVWSVALAVVTTVAGALAPSIEVLGATQTLARGFQTAVTLLLAVVAAEEMPAGARAYAISVMTMTGALGAGIAVWALPLADVGERGWRIIFLVPSSASRCCGGWPGSSPRASGSSAPTARRR